MKKLMFIFLMFFSICSTYAVEKKTHAMSFDLKDFSFTTNEHGELVISTSGLKTFYLEDISRPMLPFKSLVIEIPSSREFRSVSYSGTKVLVKENVVLACNPKPVPTNAEDVEPTPVAKYDVGIYPDKNVSSFRTDVACGHKILYLSVCPFVYDAATRNLYFIPSMNVDVEMEECENTEISQQDNIGDILQDLVDVSFVENREYFPNRPLTIIPSVEYLIVTNDALKDSFIPLRDWKRRKGVWTDIITMEFIESHYPGASPEVKLKNCLKAYYDDPLCALKYVLLGGDNTVVPHKECYAYVTYDYEITNMPTDLYYACFGGNLEWDANGNGICGELSDSICMTPSIFLTRTPVRTVSDVNAFVNKVLFYEQTPTRNGWNNNMLTCGTELWTTIDMGDREYSDAELKGDGIYEDFIASCWNGTRVKFYDTYTDFLGGANYNLNQVNLQSQLSQGYTFMQMLTHGSACAWALETGDYNTLNAEDLENDIPTIITTTSCHTNSFDSETCLSEGFMRNPYNSVVAYLGCSRQGWDYLYGTLGSSSLYDGNFYYYLFNNSTVNKNYGAVVAEAKMAMLSDCDYYSSSRWVQFGLNPMGDPEMPIYTRTPWSFSNVSITTNSNVVTVNAGVPGCRICVMGDLSNGYIKCEDGVQSITFPEPMEDYSVCITKQNYIPYQEHVLVNLFFNIAPSSTEIRETPTESENLNGELYDISGVKSSGLEKGKILINKSKKMIAK